MVSTEHQDAAAILDEFSNRASNLPAEIAFMQEEIEQKDRQMAECLAIINKNESAIQKWIRLNGSHVPNPKEDQLSRIVLENYDKAQVLQEEKLALAQRTQQIMDKHTRWLDGHIKALQDRGDFPNDPDIPSLLRPQPPERNRIDLGVAPLPLGQINNSASVAHIRHPNQHPTRPLPAHLLGHPQATTSSSAPATPAAAAILAGRARESSLGAANKRQKLNGGLVLPTSGLGRQPSNAPGTPRGGTPVSGRAGSAGPRSSQNAIKKAAPLGSKQNSVMRKPKKSGLSRVKRTGKKNSPSSTNDSELSDADSGSADEETNTTPHNRDADGDEEVGDEDGGEGEDGKIYCLCQKVSYGDMVACDNEECPYEWFHWTCVGLKSEPPDVWICPECTKNGFKPART
jgi:inhibitor of growth protein 3